MSVISLSGSFSRQRRICYSATTFSWLGSLLTFILIMLAISMPTLFAQQPGQPARPGQNQGLGANQPNVVGGLQFGGPQGGAGGAAQADFDSLIDLITSTVDTESWAENGTGEGQIAPFDINGVYADPSGTLRFASRQVIRTSLRKIPPAFELPSLATSARQPSPLRFVSLNRLEAAIAQQQHLHRPLSPEMLTLAGLQRVQYVMVYPESGDLVIAGPAGDWQIEPAGRIVGVETGLPVVRLDDLLTLWRRQQTHRTPAFGCSITPRQASLAKTQAYVQESNLRPIEPAQRKDWLEGLRKSLGKQDVEFFGLAADSRVARILLVADYHMKLVGMGIADTVNGVSSYLDTVELTADGTPPPMAVLRWWFAMNYEPVETDPQRKVFQLRGQGVKVLSENELLAARGQRVPTGQSKDLNQHFASSFTSEFEQLCNRYPLYAELRNVFDLAMVLAIIEREGLVEQVGWSPSLFTDSRRLRLPAERVPHEVDTVVSHRVIKGRHIVAGISGGVWLDAGKALKIRVSTESTLAKKPEIKSWWWD